MNIECTLERLEKYFQKPPSSEADTIRLAVLPLLKAMGYDDDEVRQEVATSGGKSLDIQVLNGRQSWVLEAKRWNLNLQAAEINQALSYAISIGCRFAILCNGVEWWLFDSHDTKPAEERLVEKYRIDSAVALEFFRALSKEAFLAGKLEVFVRERQLHRFLQAQLIDPQSEIVKATLRVAKAAGLASVASDQISQFFLNAISKPVQSAYQPVAATLELKAPMSVGPVWSNGVLEISLAELARNYINGSQPISLTVGERNLVCKGFRRMLHEVIEYLIEIDRVPQLPFRTSQKAEPFITEWEPNPKMRVPMKISSGNRVLYYEANQSGEGVAKRCELLLQTAGIDPRQCIVRLSKS